MTNMAKALDGIRVLDLTQYEAGPSCTETLAWMGAEVIKVEPPSGEVSRRGIGGATEHPDVDSAFFCLLNANKKSVTLNLRSERGRHMFEELIKTADIFVENLGPGSIERLGFSWENVSRMNPRVIMCAIKGFGGPGPYESYNSFEMIAQAMGGVMSLTGTADTPPLRIEAGLGDTASGLHAAIGILAALEQRHRTGAGQLIEIAQMDVVVNLTRIHFRDHYNGAFVNTVSDPRIATATFTDPLNGEAVRLDRQTFVLAPAFATETLTSIVFTGFHGFDPNGVQDFFLGQPFIAGVTVATEQQRIGQRKFLAQPGIRLAAGQRHDGTQLDGRTLPVAVPAAMKDEGFIAPLPRNATRSGSRDRLFCREPLRRIAGNVESENLHHSCHLAAPPFWRVVPLIRMRL
jgi:hypothetical protein